MYKILVVDDEANIRKLIAKYASFEGYQVEEASDGEQAVGLCRYGGFDLVVMDIMMPGMDGLTACAKIKEFSDVPIIMLSARGEEYDKIYGFRMGIDDYVVKPFSPKEFDAAHSGGAEAMRATGNSKEKRSVSVRWADGGFYRPRGQRGRGTGDDVTQGIRSAFLHGAEPGHCADKGKADQRSVGI